MKVLVALLALTVTAVVSQEILEVICGQDAIVARLNKQTIDSARYDIADLHFNDPECLFDEEVDGYYVKSIEPLSSCGTELVINDTHAKFVNSISAGAIETGLSYPHGIIVGQPANDQLISVSYECTYEIDLRLSVSFIPNITILVIPIPDAIGQGEFQLAMAIYKDGTYRELHGEATPTLQPEDNVFVGITMIGDASSDVFIKMRRCWATVFEDPDSEPFYDLITDGCAVDGAVEGSVAVTQNGIGHQALWQSRVFKFVGSTDEHNSVWLHCDVTICLKSSCEPVCDARRRKRRSGEMDDDAHILSYGPIENSRRTEIHFGGPAGQATIVIQNETNAKIDIRSNEAPPQYGVTDHTLLIAIGAFAAFCLLCLSMALVIVLMRLKRSNSGPSGEVTPTGTINKGFSI